MGQKSLTCQTLPRRRFLLLTVMKSGRQVSHIKRFIGRYRYRLTESPNGRPASDIHVRVEREVQVSESKSDSDETPLELQTWLHKLRRKILNAEKAKKKELKARKTQLEKDFAEKVQVL